MTNWQKTMKKIISIKAGFVEKVDDIDRSTLYTLYTFDGPFQKLNFFTKRGEINKRLKNKVSDRTWIYAKNIFDLNKKYNVEMFSTAIRDGKAFHAEQKVRKLIKKIFRFEFLEKKLSSSKRPKFFEIMWKALENINE